MNTSIHCISLWQPWASLIMGGFKEYETRSWKPPQSLIGALIAIHAAKRWTQEEKFTTERFIRDYPETAGVLRPEGYQNPPLGAVLCACRLVAVYKSDYRFESVSRRERSFGDWSTGRYVWQLEVVKVPPEPIPAAGRQGIFLWSPDA